MAGAGDYFELSMSSSIVVLGGHDSLCWVWISFVDLVYVDLELFLSLN